MPFNQHSVLCKTDNFASSHRQYIGPLCIGVIMRVGGIDEFYYEPGPLEGLKTSLLPLIASHLNVFE